MLSNALFSFAMFSTVAATLLAAGMAMTAATTRHDAQRFIAPAYQRARALVEQTLRRDLQQGALPDPLPTFAPLTPQCVDEACDYKNAATITLTGISNDENAPCGQAISCATDVQLDPYVGEGRLAVRIDVTLTGPQGDVLAQQTARVLYRTFHQPPFVMPVGTNDERFDGSLVRGVPGDDGERSASSQTQIHVVFRNAVTGELQTRDRFGDAAYGSLPASSGWSP